MLALGQPVGILVSDESTVFKAFALCAKRLQLDQEEVQSHRITGTNAEHSMPKGLRSEQKLARLSVSDRCSDHSQE
jgi:hypothetical protein